MKLGPSSAIKYTYFAPKLVQINSSFTKSPSGPLRLYTGYRFDQSMSEFIAIFLKSKGAKIKGIELVFNSKILKSSSCACLNT